MTSLIMARRVAGALFVFCLSLLFVAVFAHAATRPLTAEQEAYLAAQVEAQYGAFEKIVVRRVRSDPRFPFVQVLTKPRIVEGERSIYALIDDEHSREPCIVFGAIVVDHAVVPFGVWPAGACE